VAGLSHVCETLADSCLPIKAPQGAAVTFRANKAKATLKAYHGDADASPLGLQR